MNNKKKWGKIKRILSFVVSVVIIYYGLGFLDGSIYTGSYTKQFDDTVVTKVKMILEYTGLDGETVRTSMVEVEIPRETIQ